jgi:polyphenol oxidase
VTVAAGVRAVTEHLDERRVALWVHPEWEARFPWLVQGTTGRGSEESPFDLGLSGGQPVGEVLARWRSLRDTLGCTGITCSRQVHGAEIRAHPALLPGMQILEALDGHLTAEAGLALAVTVADCVPVSLVDPARRCVGLLHAGWRGIAAGILERGVQSLAEAFGSVASGLWVHLGPAICGPCYRVGPEVLEALGTAGVVTAGASHVDLRAVLASRALGCGVPPEQITCSSHCTRCGTETAGGVRPFFSHRASELARQVAVLGVRTP